MDNNILELLKETPNAVLMSLFKQIEEMFPK